MKIRAKGNKFELTRAERDKKAQDIIERNKDLERANVKAGKSTSTKKKRGKNVRKDERVYEQLIFAAFEKESCLNQEDFVRKTCEPWNFLRPVVTKLCDRIKNADKGGRSWVLKENFKLATDKAIETTDETTAQ